MIVMSLIASICIIVSIIISLLCSSSSILSSIVKFSSKISNKILKISIRNLKLCDHLSSHLALFLSWWKFLLHRISSSLSIAELYLLLSLNLSQLFFLFVKIFSSACALLTEHVVPIAFIFNPSFLDCIYFNIFSANIIFKLGYLSLKVFNHLLASL